MKTFEEVFRTLPGNGWLAEDEARLLWEFASQFDGDVLEVGSYEGRSAVLLANLGRRLYCVDPFEGFAEGRTGEEVHRCLVENLQSRNLDNVTVYWGKVESWPRRSVGFAYLDGDHTYEGTVEQVKVALTCDAKGIAIHDVSNSAGGKLVQDAAVDVLGRWTKKVGTMAVWDLRVKP